MARSDFRRAQDILTAIADIRSDTADLSYARFSQSPTVIRSAPYSSGFLGEVAKFLSEDLKTAAPDVLWRAIASLRDRIVHK